MKPSRIPTPSRAVPKEDENKPNLGFKRRQSRGLQGLVREQVVSKSPFLGDKRASTMAEVPTTSASLSTRIPALEKAPTLELAQAARPSTPPMPVNLRNPRVADLSGTSPSPSPKSSLVSPKRLHGPRSVSASPGSEGGRRQRRKTVTFDERCDVLEFDQDEVSDEAMELDDDDEDDYGPPEPPSPAISASTDSSLTSYMNEQDPPSPGVLHQGTTHTVLSQEDHIDTVDIDFPNRTPRISRDEIRRRLMEQRAEGFEDEVVHSARPTPETSFDISSQDLDLDGLPSKPIHSQSSHIADTYNSEPDHSTDLGIGVPFDFNEPGVDLGEMHSALDRFMLGVECGFGLDPNDGESLETGNTTEGDVSANVHTSIIDASVNIDTDFARREVEVQQPHVRQQVNVEMAEVMDLGGTDEDTDEPVTPPLDDHIGHQPSTPNKVDSMLYGAPPVDDSLPDTPTLIQGDNGMLLESSDDISAMSIGETQVLDVSTTELEHNVGIQTSTPPRSARKDQQRISESWTQSSREPSSSLALPPLCFGLPSSETNSMAPPSWSIDVPSASHSQFPKAIRDDTFLVRSSSTTSTATNNSIPPPVPPKDGGGLMYKDDFVNARKREMSADRDPERPATYHEGRPCKRRSLSTGDAEDLGSSVRILPITSAYGRLIFGTETGFTKTRRSFKG